MQITMSLRNSGRLPCLRGYKPTMTFTEYQLKTDLNLKESNAFQPISVFTLLKHVFFITHFNVYGKKVLFDLQFKTSQKITA